MKTEVSGSQPRALSTAPQLPLRSSGYWKLLGKLTRALGLDELVNKLSSLKNSTQGLPWWRSG